MRIGGQSQEKLTTEITEFTEEETSEVLRGLCVLSGGALGFLNAEMEP